MNWFDTAAHAAEGGSSGPGSMDLLLLVGFVAIFYFLLWRPQAKRRKDHQTLMTSLDKGDEVVTSGGIVGQITRIGDDFISLKVAENIEFRVQKSSIGATLPKGTLKSLDEK
jgi:preprotein translocase subunit YajC